MAKTLRVRTKEGWTTKPEADIPENRLSAEEVDDNFLETEDAIALKANIASPTFTGTVADTTINLVSSGDIGTAPNQIPLNQYLGELAFMGKDQVAIRPATSAAPAGIGELVFQLTSNTSLVIKVMGTDGVIRSNTLTLA
jgi:hypothetical protein